MDKSKIQMKLSVLIPTTRRRRHFLKRLQDQIDRQLRIPIFSHGIGRIIRYSYEDIEVILDTCESCTIGDKRNNLLENALGEYTCFIDDDDRIADDYFKNIMESIQTKPDCLSLRGIMTINGNDPQVFEHSIKYKAYKTNDGNVEVKYERYPNHLNVIKSTISKRFRFPHKNYGEDTNWATQIFKSGLIKSEVFIDKVLYYYDYRSNK